MLQIELYKFKNLVMSLSELGAANYAKIVFPVKDSISQREAYRAYGEARVKRWVRQNLITPVRSGESIKSKKLYSRAELMAIDTAEKHPILNNL